MILTATAELTMIVPKLLRLLSRCLFSPPSYGEKYFFHVPSTTVPARNQPLCSYVAFAAPGGTLQSSLPISGGQSPSPSPWAQRYTRTPTWSLGGSRGLATFLEILRIFALHGPQWQRLDFYLPELRAPWINEALNVCAPVLEAFHMRTYHQPGEELFETFRSSTPHLSSIAISSLPLGLLRDLEVPRIPWTQLLNLSIGSVPTVQDALTILSGCRRLQVYDIGIAGDPDNNFARSTIHHEALRELQLHVQCADLCGFLELTVLPGLESLAIYGRRPELSYWPYSQFVDHLHRSGTHLKALCIYTAWLWSSQCAIMFNQPALQSLVKLTIDDDLDWDSVPCFRPVVEAILKTHDRVLEHVIPGIAELSSEAIGGQIVAVSDDFFAEAFHLLLQEPAPSLKGQFGPKGALYSGWESRRHNPAYDW
ncbi:hypothetical protein H0H87_005183 [Tephrocybe sp. NHM501043]|nr:hypothetical protein H0H87_005183 [Tephrocybe sp. NHM501043]